MAKIINQVLYNFFEENEDFVKYYSSLVEKNIEEITENEYIKLFQYIDKGEKINDEKNKIIYNSPYFYRKAKNWFKNEIFIKLSNKFFNN